MDMEEETADGGLFFRTKKRHAEIVICMPPFISYYIGEMKKMIISVLKLPFITYFW